MIFYLIPAGGGHGPELAGTQSDARELCKAKGLRFDSRMQHDVPTSKWELMNYINNLLAAEYRARTGPVRGIDGPFDMDDSGKPITDIPPPVHSPSAISIAIDEEWERLPLARKLHFAALAMEDARAQL